MNTGRLVSLAVMCPAILFLSLDTSVDIEFFLLVVRITIPPQSTTVGVTDIESPSHR